MAPSPPDGIGLGGLETLFSTVIVQDEDHSITVTPSHRNPAVPSRIQCAVGLEIRSSHAGKTLHVNEAVKKGGLIFASKPRLNIVDDDDAMKCTCDNCLVTKRRGFSTRYRATSAETATSGGDSDIKFLAFGRCKTVHYCSKVLYTTLLEAWNHHHKFECKTFHRITEDGGEAILRTKGTRLIIRLLESRASGKISESEWNEVLALPTNRESRMAESSFAIMPPYIAKIAKAFASTDCSDEEIVELFCMMHNKQCVIHAPLMRGHRCLDVAVHATIRIGTCLEPFMAYTAHDCVASTMTVHEEGEIRIELRAILLLVKKSLKPKDLRFGIISRGDLRDHVKALLTLDEGMSPQHLGDVARGIKNMRDAGLKWGAEPMRRLHQQLLRGNLIKSDDAECIKIALKIRYQIEPAQYPPPSMKSRIDTLCVLQSFLYFPPAEHPESASFPKELKPLAMRVFLHLRHMLARDVAQCFGENSMVARFEKKIAEDETAALNISVRKIVGDDQFSFPALDDSDLVRSRFVLDMNELLVWAGLEDLEAKDTL
ncbi:hypothetical protein VTL71DRAFT_819 [Oculimacula yallundae]|uniref:Uncharacterized protein n=1 Tax=Oculimacula yallundae TaxID=86028 RepID=A0ABR4D282_9HELO